MDAHRLSGRFQLGLIAAALAGMLAGALPARANPWTASRTQFASDRFRALWEQADLAVQRGEVSRSWTWGPSPWFDYNEAYRLNHPSTRLVQYFDKARMELQFESAARVFLTNGLLPVEMVSGRVKFGHGIGDDENEQRQPAQIPVAGDALPVAGSITYATLAPVATTDNGYRDPEKLGQRVGTTFDAYRNIGFRQDLANLPGTEIVRYEPTTGHNVPRIFQEFIDGAPVEGLMAFGYPITDPYWITATVAGQERDVLVQLFERRSLTYTPSNPAAFRVEMGNVGQHYFQWRYPNLGLPWFDRDPEIPLVFASNQAGAFNIYRFGEFNSVGRLTTQPADITPFSIRRSWNPRYHAIFGTAVLDGRQQLVQVPFSGGTPQRVLTSSANDSQPAVSPDGTKIAFVSDRDGNPELYLLTIGSSAEPTRLTETSGCANQHPTWSPHGGSLAYASNCLDGNFELYAAPLRYTSHKLNDLRVLPISPGGRDTIRLTTNGTDDRDPRFAPDSYVLAFTATRDGDPEIYIRNLDSGTETRLTYNVAVDQGPTWAPDGSKIAFNSNRDGDFEVFYMSRNGTNPDQLTANTADDGFTVWAQ